MWSSVNTSALTPAAIAQSELMLTEDGEVEAPADGATSDASPAMPTKGLGAAGTADAADEGRLPAPSSVPLD